MASENPFWMISAEQAAEELKSDLKKGISSQEASKRLAEHGPNILPSKKSRSAWILLGRQFSSLIIWILIVAAFISQILGEEVGAYAIFAIVILNSLLGFFQEYFAERSLKALQKLAIPHARVNRGGRISIIPNAELVPGDLVILEAGDRVPADGRLIYAAHLTTQEAVLTGESLPVEKNRETIDRMRVALGDRRNMAYMGTLVSSGKAEMLVTATGRSTEIGQIASLLESGEKSKTPLQIQLGKLGNRLVWVCLGIVVLVFFLGLLRGFAPFGLLLTSLSLAVAAIPEGLPAIVTISLSIGVRRMVRRNALVRRLSSVETLGCTTVICTDKTGTLTLNEMTVYKIWGDEKFSLRIGALCNNASLSFEGEITGDPTEGALLVAARKAKVDKEEAPLLAEVPFDSDRKWMSMLRQTKEGPQLFVKGAPDIVLKHASHWWNDGNILPLTKEKYAEIHAAQTELANQGLRLLAVAYQQTEHLTESGWIFVGLISLRDPPRPEARAALKKCLDAGIRPVMITGDHQATALAIAHELKIAGKVKSGDELDAMSQEELEKEVDQIGIYARTTAAHKLRIIHALKKRGDIVAMTGDGINDAPAIQEADIGVAMGITGSEVTKETADMILLDDNFASIVSAVEEGRGIYDNIVKFVSYLLSSNIAEILVIFIAMLIGMQFQGQPFVPLLPVQLLWMNLVTDGFPAIALAMDPLDPTAMKKPPRSPHKQVLHLRFALFLISISVLITTGALISCAIGLKTSPELAQTMALTTLIVLQLVRIQMIRAEYRVSLFSNRWLLFALVSSFALQLMIIYIPALQPIFGTTSLGLREWIILGAVAFSLWWLGRFISWSFKKLKKN